MLRRGGLRLGGFLRADGYYAALGWNEGVLGGWG